MPVPAREANQRRKRRKHLKNKMDHSRKDQELLRKYAIGTDHLMDYLGKRLFAFTQDQKRRKREAERRTNAAKKMREANKPQAEKDEEKQLGNNFFAMEDREESLTDEEKQQKIRGQSQKLAAEVRNELITIKRLLNAANSLEQIIPVAKAIRALIPHMNIARQQMAPIPKPNPPIFRGDEDPVTKLKKTTNVAVREFETVWQGIFNVVCGNPTLEQLIALSGVISGSLSVLQEATREAQAGSG